LGSNLQARRGAELCPQLVGQIERAPDRIAADLAGDQSHIWHALTQCGCEDALLLVPVRCDHHRRVVGTGIAVLRRAQLDGVAQPLSQVRQRQRDRALAYDPDRRRRKVRFEEDLQRPSAEAGVLDRDRSIAGGGFALGLARQDAKQQGLARLQHAQRVQAYRGLGAGAADETLDGAIAAHNRRVAGPDAGRALRADDRGLDEGNPPGDQLFLSELGKLSSDHLTRNLLDRV